MLTIREPSFSLAALIDPADTNKIISEPRALLAEWSLAIENAVIEQQLPAHVLAGFQQIGNIKPILSRFLELASIVDALTIVGLPDGELDFRGMRQVILNPDDELCHEWFLIVRHPDYPRALIAREERSNPGHFRGVLTSDAIQVERYYWALTHVIAAE